MWEERGLLLTGGYLYEAESPRNLKQRLQQKPYLVVGYRLGENNK